MGTVRYRAPELLDLADAKKKECRYTEAVDTWSWGCVLHEMLSGQLYMPEKDSHRSHLHIIAAASLEHQVRTPHRTRNVHHPYVYHIAGHGVARMSRPLGSASWRSASGMHSSWRSRRRHKGCQTFGRWLAGPNALPSRVVPT